MNKYYNIHKKIIIDINNIYNSMSKNDLAIVDGKIRDKARDRIWENVTDISGNITKRNIISNQLYYDIIKLR